MNQKDTIKTRYLYRGILAGLGMIALTNACAPNVAYVAVGATSEASPAWIISPDTGVADNQKAFVGMSQRTTQERDAREQALNDALSQVAQYTGVTVHQISELFAEYQSGRGQTGHQVALKNKTDLQADTYIYGVENLEWHIVEFQHHTSSGVEPAFEAHVRLLVPVDQLTELQAEKNQARLEQNALATARARQKLLEDVVKSTAGVLPWHGQSSEGVMDWYAGVYRVTAKGFADTRQTSNRAQLETLALSAARQMAYAGLNELINGVSVQTEAVTQGSSLVKQSVVVRHEGRVRARVLDEKVTWIGQEPVGTVTVESVMHTSVSGLDYTRGIIIDARQSQFIPTLLARLVNPQGEELAGPAQLRAGNLHSTGTFLYSPSMSQAVQLLDQAASPLVIKPISAGHGKLTLSVVDSQRLQAYLAGDVDADRFPVIVVF